MIKFICKIAGYLFSALLIVELIINYWASNNLFPIKYADSFGFLEWKTGKVIVPLNKYNSRFLSCIFLPVELLYVKYYDKALTPVLDDKTKLYGYSDDKGKLIIEYKFDNAKDFAGSFAIVSISDDGKKKFGLIDKKGDWVVAPEYSYICDNNKYYIKACLDKDHCGVIDKFGNKITQMTYTINNIQCKDCDRMAKFCSIGAKNKKTDCGYFLW